MANTPLNSGSTITATNTYQIGAGGATQGVVGTLAVHLVSTSFSGSITVKARVVGSGATFLAIPYVALYQNGAVAGGAYSTSALTDTSIILIPSTGLEIALDCTAYTSGTMTVYTRSAVGAAA